MDFIDVVAASTRSLNHFERSIDCFSSWFNPLCNQTPADGRTLLKTRLQELAKTGKEANKRSTPCGPVTILRDSPALSTFSLRGKNVDSDHLQRHQTQLQHGKDNTHNKQARRPAAVSTSSNFSIEQETIPQFTGSKWQHPTRLVNVRCFVPALNPILHRTNNNNRDMACRFQHYTLFLYLPPQPFSHTPTVSLRPRHLIALRVNNPVYNRMRHTSLFSGTRPARPSSTSALDPLLLGSGATRQAGK